MRAFGRFVTALAFIGPIITLFAPAAAWAGNGDTSAGDTAWMLTATALVLAMTLPGLSLFYSGLVRAKNALSLMAQCFVIAAIVTVLWVVCGYSLAFTPGTVAPAVIGDLSRAFLLGVDGQAMSGGIPEALFLTFQLTFAIITPALAIGSVAERMRFSALLWFTALWLLLVYVPIAHWVWGGGWLQARDALDFAGGTVVHINAGVAGLVAAWRLGPRRGWPVTAMPPHSLMLTMTGAGLLWVGWFGFNAGSALAADGSAAMALGVTQAATAAGALAWMILEWRWHRRPSALGLASGAVAGLVAITPAAGFVGFAGALVIGAAAGVAGVLAVNLLKPRLRIDDSLDAFFIHGVAGILGALLTGVFAAESLGGVGLPAGRGILDQLGVQALAVAATLVYDGIVTGVIVILLDRTIGLRVGKDEEIEGLDLALHGERAYDL